MRTFSRINASLDLLVPAALWLASLGACGESQGQQPDPAREAAARTSMASMHVPEELSIELFAADPMVESPLALSIDERGRLLVTEVHRFNRGTEENRTRPFLLEDDLQIGTVDERLRMFERWADRFEGGMAWFSKYADRVRVLEDRDGDGHADVSSILTSFQEPPDGLAAGVLAFEGDIFVTCIPHLWRLRDEDGDGHADRREILLTGFGVNAAFLGHDLHGLTLGPDRRLYFSVGDRGFHVRTREGELLDGPRTGGVFRCELDGSHLELLHRGLRNPQELAFDRFGNLFAVDNNCDKGDHSRLVLILPGADSGWNMAYQTIPEPYLTGPWHAERMWHIPAADQPAWIVPAVDKLGAGPCGFAFYPGIGLPARYADHFFYCNYTARGGIESFAVEPRGAGFAIVDHRDFLKPVNATDLEFGYDGTLFVADYVDLDWSGKSLGGRIYTLRAKGTAASSPAMQPVEWHESRVEQLAAWLHHPDHRIRLRAQWELARRDAVDVLEQAAAGDGRQPRLHGIWGLSQIARRHPEVGERLVRFLDADDEYVRCWAVRGLSEIPSFQDAAPIRDRLRDSSPMVRMYAAIALGRIRDAESINSLARVAIENHDVDPWLRHGVVMGLSGCASADDLVTWARHEHRSVRLAILLALRRVRDPRIAGFLSDPDLGIVTEAARAVYDLPLPEGMAALAAWGERAAAATQALPDALLRRVVAANQRLGTPFHAYLVAEIAANSHHSLAARRDALDALRHWDRPPPRDRVLGYWRPVPARLAGTLRDALDAQFVPWVSRLDPELLPPALELARELQIEFSDALLDDWARDATRPSETRIAALRLLAARHAMGREGLIKQFLEEPDFRLRVAARRLWMELDPPRALASIRETLEDDEAPVPERQAALRLAAQSTRPEADALLRHWARRLAEGRVAPPLQLDVLEATRGRTDPIVQEAVRSFTAARQESSPFGLHQLCLEGGDPEIGRKLFVGHLNAQCVRCHKIEDFGGDAGPELTHVASRGDRPYLLESLLRPSAKIAPGYGVVTLMLDTGKVVTGTIVEEDARRIVLRNENGVLREMAADRVDARTEPRSAMPPVRDVLTLSEIRDLVAFLAELRE